MNIVVTGGTGFFGQAIRNALSASHTVHSCSRKEGIDIRDYEQISAFLKEKNPELVVHAAAHVGGIAYNAQHPVEVFDDNVQIGLNIAKACAENGVKHLVNVMPNCVYPGALDFYEESKIWDGPLHDSVLTYGLPRKMLYGACFAHTQQNPEFSAIHLVFPNMYGPHDHFEIVKSHALGALIKKVHTAVVENSDTVEIWGTGKPIREWIYVEDAAEAVKRSIENIDKFQANEFVNIGIGKGISIKDMADAIKGAFGWQGTFEFDTSRPDGAMKKILSNKIMLEKLDWQPPTELSDGITSTVEWFKQNHDKVETE